MGGRTETDEKGGPMKREVVVFNGHCKDIENDLQCRLDADWRPTFVSTASAPGYIKGIVFFEKDDE